MDRSLFRDGASKGSTLTCRRRVPEGSWEAGFARKLWFVQDGLMLGLSMGPRLCVCMQVGISRLRIRRRSRRVPLLVLKSCVLH
jgi:hypothetical protein